MITAIVLIPYPNPFFVIRSRSSQAKQTQKYMKKFGYTDEDLEFIGDFTNTLGM